MAKPTRNQGEILLFKPKGHQTEIRVKLKGDTVWLSLNQIAELFNKDKSVISRHLRNIYKTNELQKKATVAKNATVQIEGRREVIRQIEYRLWWNKLKWNFLNETG